MKNINTKSINGILLPAIIIEINIKKNIKDNTNNEFFLFLKFKNKGARKNIKILNLCRYEPAIGSLPKGPESLYGVFKLPKISLPKFN